MFQTSVFLTKFVDYETLSLYKKQLIYVRRKSIIRVRNQNFDTQVEIYRFIIVSKKTHAICQRAVNLEIGGAEIQAAQWKKNVEAQPIRTWLAVASHSIIARLYPLVLEAKLKVKKKFFA